MSFDVLISLKEKCNRNLYYFDSVSLQLRFNFFNFIGVPFKWFIDYFPPQVLSLPDSNFRNEDWWWGWQKILLRSIYFVNLPFRLKHWKSFFSCFYGSINKPSFFKDWFHDFRVWCYLFYLSGRYLRWSSFWDIFLFWNSVFWPSTIYFINIGCFLFISLKKFLIKFCYYFFNFLNKVSCFLYCP